MMKAIVINLDAETKRMAFQLSQAKALGFQVERLPATAATDVEPAQTDPYWRTWERPLLATEMAALASHKSAWRIVASGTTPRLILEDDAYLSSNLPPILKNLKTLQGVEHVSFETRGRKKILGDAQLGHPIRRLFQDRTGAAAYLLWPSGARKLLERTKTRAGLADGVICAATELASYQAYPALAVQLDQCDRYGLVSPLKTSSAISRGDANQRPRSSASMVYRFRRIAAQLRMGTRAIKVGNRSEKVLVEPDTGFDRLT
jgi:glycosyl transferase family 25